MDPEKGRGSGPLVQEEHLTPESIAEVDYSSTAPEVYHDEPSLQPVPRHTEPEVYYDQSGLQPVHLRPVSRAYETDSAPELYYKQSNQQHSRSTFTKRQRLCLLSALIVFLALIAVGLGIGVYLGQHPNDNNIRFNPINSTTMSSPSTSSSSSAGSRTSTNLASSTSITVTLPSPTPSTAPVTTGSTGIAANDCETRGSDTYLTNNNPTTFTFDCGTDYPNGESAFNSTSKIVQDIPIRLISYTFEDCIEQCAIYNAQNPGAMACTAITYNANLTLSVGGQSGNCFLKTLRGKQMSEGTASGKTTASAYVASQ